MTSDAKLPITAYLIESDEVAEYRWNQDPSGDWCKAADVRELVERMDAQAELRAIAAAEEHYRRAVQAESELDRLVEALRSALSAERSAHAFQCGYRMTSPRKEPCSCGLDELRKALADLDEDPNG